MPRAKLTPRETVEKLQLVQALMAEGRPLEQALRWAEMTEADYVRCKTEYDGLLRTLGPMPLGSTRPSKRKRRSSSHSE